MAERDDLQPPQSGDPGEATLLLSRIESGDAEASELLLPLVYGELRAIAAGYFRRERPNHTLEPTALVHEAYLKLVGAANQNWRSRSHFAAVAARAMRQILMNHAEAKGTAKRGGGKDRVPLEALTIGDHGTIDVVELNDVLSKLSRADERQGRIVELKFFSELDTDQIADVLEISSRSVERSWRSARAWLNTELSSHAE